MKLYMTTPDGTNWHLQNSVFVNELTDSFQDVDIRYATGHWDIDWRIEHQREIVLIGHFREKDSGIFMEGDIAFCAEFAIWYRTLIPSNIGLILFDEQYSVDMFYVEMGTTSKDILRHFDLSDES